VSPNRADLRITGTGLIRVDETKTAAGRRTLALPSFAVETLRQRPSLPHLVSIQRSSSRPRRTPGAIRTTSAGNGAPSATSWGSPKWRRTASVRRSRLLSARVGTDHLGHSRVSMIQDVYMARGKVHMQVADLLDDAINDAYAAAPRSS